MNTLALPMEAAPSIREVMREHVARLEPELQDRLVRLLVGAGAGVIGLAVRWVLAESPTAGLITSLITTFLVELTLPEIVHTVLF